jgi:hypothetical protein
MGHAIVKTNEETDLAEIGQTIETIEIELYDGAEVWETRAVVSTKEIK